MLLIMEYKTRMNEVNTESLASTQRMKAYLEEADGAAVETMANLESQGEQLRRVDKSLDRIDQEIRVADRNLTQLDKFCGMCLCPCRRSKNLKSYSDTVEIKYEKKKKTQSSSPKKKNEPMDNNQNGSTANRYINRVANDDKEDEMEENMESISAYLKDLKVKAKVMGNEIETQNETIDQINVKVARNKENIELSNKHASDVMAR